MQPAPHPRPAPGGDGKGRSKAKDGEKPAFLFRDAKMSGATKKVRRLRRSKDGSPGIGGKKSASAVAETVGQA
jgi:hypothetical protein